MAAALIMRATAAVTNRASPSAAIDAPTVAIAITSAGDSPAIVPR